MIQNYLTVAQIKAYTPVNEISTSTTWDTLLLTLTTNLSRSFDTLTRRKPGAYFVTDDVTRYYDGVPVTATDFTDTIVIGELAAIPTSVNVSESGDPSDFALLPSSNYFMWPYNALDDGKPFTQVNLNLATGGRKQWPSAPRSIQVVGKFGWSASIPADIFEALLLYAVRMVRKAQDNYQEVGTLLDSGQVLVGMQRDPDLANIIDMYLKSRLVHA